MLVNFTSVPTGTVVITSKNLGGPIASSFEWDLYINPTGGPGATATYEFRIASGGTLNVLDWGSTLTTGWHFLYMDFDSRVGHLLMSFNVDNSGSPVTFTASGNQNAVGSNPLDVGCNTPGGTPNNFMTGKVGAILYYQRQLTAGEQTTLFNLGLTLTFEQLSGTLLNNLGAIWDFTDVSNPFNDDSGNSNNFTNHNTVTIVPR